MSNNIVRSTSSRGFSAIRAASSAAALCLALTCAAATAGHAQGLYGAGQYSPNFSNAHGEGGVSCGVLSPSPTQKFTAPATISISAGAYSKSRKKIKKIEFYVGDHQVGVVTAEPYTVVVTGLSAGSYNLKVKAFDDSGVEGDSATVKVTVSPQTTTSPGTAHLVGIAPTTTLATDGTLQIQFGIKNDGNGAARNVSIASISAYDDPTGRKATVKLPSLPNSIDHIDPGAVASFTIAVKDFLPSSGYLFLIVKGSYVSGDAVLQAELAGGLRLPHGK